MITGYKWTARKADLKLFIVKLKCNNEYIDPSACDPVPAGDEPAFKAAFYSTDCKVVEIADEQGNRVDEVDGVAYYPFKYYAGQQIKGRKIFYYHDISYCIRFGKMVIEQRKERRGWCSDVL